MRPSLRHIAVAALAAALTGVPPMADASDKTAKIKLDVYSGRENPEWALTAAETEELMRRFGMLPVVANGPVLFDGLGYRSASAEFAGGGEIVASRGFVTYGAQKRLDPDRAFENWLVATGAGHAPEPLLARIRKEISGEP